MGRPKDHAQHEVNVEIWERTRDPNELLIANITYPRAAASKHAQKVGRMHLFEEYLQAAYEGFLHAFKVKPWDPDRGTLATFVDAWMRNKMQYVDRKSGWVGITAPWSIVQGTMSYENLPHMGSLDADFKKVDGHGRHRTLYDTTPARDRPIEWLITQLANKEEIEKLARVLPERERAWFYDWMHVDRIEKPLKELAALWQCSKPTVANRLGKIKLLLRSEFSSSIKGEVTLGRFKNEEL